MHWLLRAFALLIGSGVFMIIIDFLCLNVTLDKECRACYRSRYGVAHPSRYGFIRLNRHCPTCAREWAEGELSAEWLPQDRQWLAVIFLVALLPAILTTARLARCPECGGEGLTRMDIPWPRGPIRCPRCHGEKRVTLIKRWLKPAS